MKKSLFGPLLTLMLASTLTLTVAVRTAAAQDSSFVPTATTIPCPMALPASEVEGKTVTCGQISVPEDWDNTAGKQIAITYARAPQQVAVAVSRSGHLF